MTAKRLGSDITGMVFGKLTALHLSRKEGIRMFWAFRCECGNEIVRRRDAVTRNSKACCGCSIPQLQSGEKHHLWTGCGELSGGRWSSIQQAAFARQKRGRECEFDITIEDAWKKFVEQDRRCVFTGEILTFELTDKRKKYSTASLDRIDSSKGYVIGNIQWVSKNINKMKLDHSDEDFIELCKQVAKHREHG